MTNLRFPNINAGTEREQLAQIKSYLHQLVGELNWALNSRDSGNAASVDSVARKELENSITRLQSMIKSSGRARSISDSGWISLGLSDEVYASTSTGRTGSGCYYRVENGSHVYVAFNAGLTYTGNTVTVSENSIPSELRPAGNVHGLHACAGHRIARGLVDSAGCVKVDWVLDFDSGADEIHVDRIDGYIDYWV